MIFDKTIQKKKGVRLKMGKFFMKKLNNRKGFTLIELIVVIAILGVLAAVAVPRLIGFQDRARATTHNANIRTIEGAASMWVAENGNPPTGHAAITDASGVIVPTYLQAMPVSPWATVTGHAQSTHTYKVTISAAGIIVATLSAPLSSE